MFYHDGTAEKTINEIEYPSMSEQETSVEQQPKAAIMDSVGIHDDDCLLDWTRVLEEDRPSDDLIHRRSTADLMHLVESSEDLTELDVYLDDLIVSMPDKETNLSGLSVDMDPAGRDRRERKSQMDEAGTDPITLTGNTMLENSTEDCQPRSERKDDVCELENSGKLGETGRRQRIRRRKQCGTGLPEGRRRSKSHGMGETTEKSKMRASTSHRDLAKHGDISRHRKSRERVSAHKRDHRHSDREKRKSRQEQPDGKINSRRSGSSGEKLRSRSSNMNKSDHTGHSSQGHHGERQNSNKRSDRLYQSERQLAYREEVEVPDLAFLDGAKGKLQTTNVAMGEQVHNHRPLRTNGLNTESKGKAAVDANLTNSTIAKGDNDWSNCATTEHEIKLKHSPKTGPPDRLHASEGVLASNHGDARDRCSDSKQYHREAIGLDISNTRHSGSKKGHPRKYEREGGNAYQGSNRSSKHHQSRNALDSQAKSTRADNLGERRNKNRSSGRKVRDSSRRRVEDRENIQNKARNGSTSRLMDDKEDASRTSHRDVSSDRDLSSASSHGKHQSMTTKSKREGKSTAIS